MKLRKLWLFIGFLMVLAVVVFSLIPEPPSVGEYKGIDKLEHGLAYGCLMLWFVQLYSRTGTRWIIAFFLVLLGIVIEYLQGFSGYRSFEYADMLANTVGVLLGLLLSHTPLAGILERVEGILARK